MRPSIVYIDESGHAGDVAGHSAPFTAQPTFALAAVVEHKGSAATETLLRDLRSSHHLQAKELKWTSFANKPRALGQLIDGLARTNTRVFVELMDKRYYVANNIVTYVLGDRRLDFSREEVRAIAITLANVLATDVGDEPLLAYSQLAKEPTKAQFETFLLMLRTGIHDGMENTVLRAKPSTYTVLECLDGLLDDVVSEWYEAGASADVDRFVQEPDESLGGHRLGLLPQVQAVSNLLGRLNRSLHQQINVLLVHDEQNEFRHLIGRYLALLTSNTHRVDLEKQTAHAQAPVSWDFPTDKFRLSFGDSVTTPGIQIADILAGFCRARLDAVSAGRRPDERFDAAANALNEMAPAGILFVTTDERLRRFLGRTT